MIKLYKKIFLWLLPVLLLFSSCSKNTIENNNAEAISNIIKIYRYDHDRIFSDSIEIFKRDNPNQMINEVVIESNDYSADDKMMVELMAGQGPDIIKINNNAFSISKLVKSGIFSDLNPLINADKNFQISDYKKEIFDCGLIDSCRYFIPIGYGMPVLLTTGKILRDTSININTSTWSWDQFIDYYNVFKKNTKADSFISNDKFSFFECLLMSCGIDFYEKSYDFNSKEFIKFLETYKHLNDDFPTSDMIFKYKYMYYDMFKNDVLFSICENDGLSLNPVQLSNMVSGVKHYLEDTIAVFPFPTINNNSPIAVPENIIAINSKSKNKENAFKLVKILLSDEIQSSSDFTDGNEGVPINNHAFNKLIKKYMENDTEEQINTDFGYIHREPLSQNLIYSIDKITENIKECRVIDPKVSNLIWKETQEFIKNKISVQEAAKRINSSVNLYNNE